MSGAFRSGRKIRPVTNFFTPFSSSVQLDRATRRTTLDPSIRDIEEEGLGGLRNLVSVFRGLPQVAVNRFQRNLEQARSRVARGFDRRGLGGSSIASSFLQGQARQDEEQLAEVLTSATAQAGAAEQSVLRDILNVSNTRTARELQTLGFDARVAQMILQARIREAERGDASRLAALGFIGRGLGAVGTVT